jgi:transposase
LIDREAVRNHFKRYRKGGLAALQRNDAGGSDAALTEEQQRLLDQHLRENLYHTAKEIAHYVEQTWQVTYSESGMKQLLHRLGVTALTGTARYSTCYHNFSDKTGRIKKVRSKDRCDYTYSLWFGGQS